MLGILFLIFIYRYYANLAKRYAKVKWHYGLLGSIIFMAVQMTVGGLYGFYLAITEPGELEDESTVVGITPLNLIGWSIAGGTVWGVHKILEYKLISERQTQPSIDIDLIGKKETE
ncbi:hypothetical protein [Elizabethkingia ursingii]|uniref:hypothetical protein n=1 Tax=Elizabethkingia ursingii TaxID=1756150 RepID=UPI002011D03A|nr:hypothetical protein [Elizabethkingia ursingii]MCL1671925.1 hypothetical protein [Elizabethkingia ursingii]